MNDLTCFYWFTPPIIPASFSAALTYEEQVLDIWDKLFKLEKVIDGALTNAVQQANEYTDKKVEGFQTQVAQINSNFNVFKNETDEKIKNLTDKVNSDISDLTADTEKKITALRVELEQKQKILESKLDTEIENLEKNIDSEIRIINGMITGINNELLQINERFNDLSEVLNGRIDSAVIELKQYVDLLIAETSGKNILVNNPVTGTITNLDVALENIYAKNLEMGSITAGEYAQSGITTGEYAETGITAGEYATIARFKLFNYLYVYPLESDIRDDIEELKTELQNEINQIDMKNYILNPFTGLRSPLEDVVLVLVNLHRNVYTIGELDSLGITYGELDGKGMTVYDFDFRNKEFL